MNQDLTLPIPPRLHLSVSSALSAAGFNGISTCRELPERGRPSRPPQGRLRGGPRFVAAAGGAASCRPFFGGAWLLPLPGSVGVWEGGRFLPQRNAKIVRNARIMLYNGSMRKVTSIILVVVAVSCNAFARGSDGVPCLCEIVPTNETYSLISSTVVCSIIRLGQNTQQGVAFAVRAGRGGVTWAL